MRKLKRFLKPVALVLATLAVVVALGFVERSSGRRPVTALEVKVDSPEGVRFIDEAAVRQLVLESGEGVIGSPVGDVEMTAIEEQLRGLACVSDADLYHTMDGTLHVRVKQRLPIVRVFNSDGSSFYIDRDGWSMPPSDTYTPRVLVVSGQLAEPYREGEHLVNASDSLNAATRSDDILGLARTLSADPFWNALVDQVVVDANGDFELLPRIGGQRVAIGDGTDLERRLQKLRLFYEKGIPQTDWRRYARIDVRFADQIVCTKRTTP
jgi:cell division protein FtsQ